MHPPSSLFVKIFSKLHLFITTDLDNKGLSDSKLGLSESLSLDFGNSCLCVNIWLVIILFSSVFKSVIYITRDKKFEKWLFLIFVYICL